MIHHMDAAARAAAVIVTALSLAACDADNAQPMDAAQTTHTTLEDGSEFVVRVTQTGAGESIAAGQVASVHYTGWLHDPEAADERGTKFDSSVDRDAPFQFPLGQGRVIRGWDVGVDGMQVGEKRELIIPALWAYGDRGAGNVIPPGATLLFEVELLGIQ